MSESSLELNMFSSVSKRSKKNRKYTLQYFMRVLTKNTNRNTNKPIRIPPTVSAYTVNVILVTPCGLRLQVARALVHNPSVDSCRQRNSKSCLF